MGEEKTALLEVPTEYREDVLEMRSWLAVSVRNGLDGFKEVMQTISHYVEQVPQMRRWLWESLSGGMQRAVRAALVE